MLSYPRETDQNPGGGPVRQRVRYWSALALLRALASSPRAAAVTLLTRARNLDAEDIHEADQLGRSAVLDLPDEETYESADAAAGDPPGAVGVLQFDVVSYRLKDEYGVDARFESVATNTARWIACCNLAVLKDFREKSLSRLALDHTGSLVYLASSAINLQMTDERWPQIRFLDIREQDAVRS